MPDYIQTDTNGDYCVICDRMDINGEGITHADNCPVPVIEQQRRDFSNLAIMGEELCKLLEYYAGQYEDSQGTIEEFRKRAKAQGG